jgi:hypothetical protein
MLTSHDEEEAGAVARSLAAADASLQKLGAADH